MQRVHILYDQYNEDTQTVRRHTMMHLQLPIMIKHNDDHVCCRSIDHLSSATTTSKSSPLPEIAVQVARYHTTQTWKLYRR